MSEYDTPWKQALDRFLQAFLQFFYPHVYDAIDWTRQYEILDKELMQIVREGELGRRVADKLFKVWLRDGEEIWLLIHIEIQSQVDPDFAERMFIYHYRIYDLFRRPLVSLAVLGDESPDWRPTEYTYDILGCKLSLRFLMVKLLDFAQNMQALEDHPNVFGLIVLAHLQSQATRGDPSDRCVWKIRLAKKILDRGFTAEELRQLLTLIDWMLELPDDLADRFSVEVAAYEREKQMKPYVPSFERKAHQMGLNEGMREGLLQAIRIGLEQRFSANAQALYDEVSPITDVKILLSIQTALWKAASVDDVRRLISQSPINN